MSDNWIVANLENAFSTWNDKMAEIWSLVTTSSQNFKGGRLYHKQWLRICDTTKLLLKNKTAISIFIMLFAAFYYLFFFIVLPKSRKLNKLFA